MHIPTKSPMYKYRGEVGGWGRVPFSRNLMSPTPRRKWYLTTGRRFHKWYSTPSPNLSPYIFLGLDPSPPPLVQIQSVYVYRAVQIHIPTNVFVHWTLLQNEKGSIQIFKESNVQIHLSGYVFVQPYIHTHSSLIYIHTLAFLENESYILWEKPSAKVSPPLPA